MFYCDDCAKKRNYPISHFKSRGNCEVCGKTCKCNDVPSENLPIFEKDGSKSTWWGRECQHKKTVALNEEGHAGIYCIFCGKQLEKEC